MKYFISSKPKINIDTNQKFAASKAYS